MVVNLPPRYINVVSRGVYTTETDAAVMVAKYEARRRACVHLLHRAPGATSRRSSGRKLPADSTLS